MSKNRHVDNGENRLSIAVPTDDDPTLIVCPKCSRMAKVLLAGNQPEEGYRVKAICASCGFSREKVGNEQSFYWRDEDPSDSYFEYSLWLKVPCCGHSLWAFNRRHLRLLESYVDAELRERPKGDVDIKNASIASRLPKWIKSAKHREQVSLGIQKLKLMAEGR
jgi:hypothetical protein